MKILLIFTMLFQSSAFARDCFKESTQLYMGLQVTGVLNDMLEREELCEKRSEMWEEERKAYKEGYRELRSELSKKGDISSDHVMGTSFEQPVQLTQAEICQEVDKEIKKKSSCYLPSLYLNELKEEDFMEMKFEDVCQKYFPRLKRIYKNCRK